MKAIFWNVRLNGKLIDSVPYNADCDKDYVYKSLVNHDGYDPAIVVSKSITRGKKAKYNFLVNDSLYFSKECTPKQALKEFNKFAEYRQAYNNSPIPITVRYELAK